MAKFPHKQSILAMTSQHQQHISANETEKVKIELQEFWHGNTGIKIICQLEKALEKEQDT